MVGINTWNLPKHYWMTHHNPFFMDGLNSMPKVGIQEVSLKACKRQDSMCHRIMVMAQVEKMSTPLDLGHWDSAKGGPILWVHEQGILF